MTLRAPVQPTAEEREPYMLVVVGKRGVGKTHETLKRIAKYVSGNPRTGAKGRRVLIFDVNNEFTQFKSIALSHIKQWCDNGVVEVRRVRIFKTVEDAHLDHVFDTPTGKMTLDEMARVLSYINDKFHNGMILVEDINKYVSDSMPNDLIGALCTLRHVGVDCVIHFQTIGKYGHPKILGNANYLRFHKVSDTVKRHKAKFNEYIVPLSICETLVNSMYEVATNRAERSFHVYYDANDYKIKGAFTKRQFMHAVETFLEKNYKEIVAPALKEINLRTGEKKYSGHQEVVDTLTAKYITQYYGNAA